MSSPQCWLEIHRPDVYSLPRAITPMPESSGDMSRTTSLVPNVCATRGDYSVRSPLRDSLYVAKHFTGRSTGLDPDAITLAWRHSCSFSLFHKESLVGFARFVTDYVVFAYLADFFVEEEHRSSSEWLLEVVIQQPFVKTLRRMTMHTKEEDQALYKAAGWHSVANPQRIMELSHE